MSFHFNVTSFHEKKSGKSVNLEIWGGQKGSLILEGAEDFHVGITRIILLSLQQFTK